jgi:hypothetical protein
MKREPALYGIFIGIDEYRPDRRPLSGCVRDVRQLEVFFLTRLKHLKKQIYSLIAPRPGSDEAAIPQQQQPTYENIIRTCQRVSARAKAGDLVWIYFAGHGARIRTAYPQAKGPAGIDEALVLWRKGSRARERYLRDVELGYLLQAMVEKGLIVTLVLDCCHSGGATRGNEQVSMRGLGYIDTPSRAASSLVASSQELSENWLALQRERTRGFEICSGWLPQPEGYVLLAACRDFEGAREAHLSGSWQSGVFTYYLLKTLYQMPPESTYRMVYHRVRAKVHAHFAGQTPQLEGEHDRVVFGSNLLEQTYAVNVLSVQPREGSAEYILEVDAGQLHTLQEGAQFWVYPNPVRVSSAIEAEQRLASIEISELGSVWSRAVVSADDARRLQAGDQAVLIAAGPLRLSHKVRVVPQSIRFPTIDQDRPLRETMALIKQYNGAFIRLADPAEDADFLVTISSDLSYEIQDADGQAIHNLRPALPITDPHAVRLLVERLVHLAKYRNVLRLENQSGPSSLVGRLHAELSRKQEDGQMRWRSEAGASLILEPGEKVDLVITNNSQMRLHVAVLDLAQDWSIQQLYPWDNTLTLEPRQTETIPLEATLATSYNEGIDTLKVFAALDVSDFHGLHLPPLDQPALSRRSRSDGPGNALEELLEAFFADAPLHRGLKVLRKAEWEWTCTSVEVYIRRR